MMKPFSKIEPSLQRDGSLRDFYIHNTTSDDWNKLLKFVIPTLEDECFLIDCKPAEMPNNYREIDEIHKEASPLLSIPVAGKYLNCHFFCEEVIELDFWPYDFNNSDRWRELSDFLQQVVNLIQKTGIVTYENDSETKEPIETFKPN
jgi:hypothetical protein